MSFIAADVIEKVLQGDGDSFTSLVDAYQRPVYNLCSRMLGNAQEAEDAAQETFWKAYQALDRYDPKRSFITWLLSIAAHHCIDQQRKRRIQFTDIELLPDGGLADPEPGPEGAVSRSEEDEGMHQLLNSLQPLDRAAIILKYWYEFSEVEIANALNLTQSAVKSRLFRARRQLAEEWESKQNEKVSSGEQHVSPAF